MYNKEKFPRVMQTAGKITILTALTGVLVFVTAFIFDAGTKQLSQVSAQTASTTLTVLNTPPEFTVNAYEVIESSTSSPTNSGDVIQWAAIGTDTNGAPYFLLICDQNLPPEANEATSSTTLGTAPPDCNPGAVQWGVSASTTSGTLATVSTTTSEDLPFQELNNWFAWVCDDDPVLARCNSVPVQGFSATNSSPFHVNRRPVLDDFYNNGPVDPGGSLTFFSTSSDPDSVGGEDDIFLVVCQTDTYDDVTNTCASNFLASTSVGVNQDATALYTLASIVRDDTYGAFGFIVDEHGHEALANPINENFIVNNVAPTVTGGDIELNGISNLNVNVPGGETTGFTLDFTIRDANSCMNTSDVPGSEIDDYVVSIFRASYGTTTCDGTSGSYDPNYCYPSGVATTTWDLDCTVDTSACIDATTDFVEYSCTFPLWFVADPTDAGVNVPAALEQDNWSAGVAGRDDDGLLGAMSTTTNPKDVVSFTALDLLTAEIPYGSLEPGDDTGTLSATTTVLNIGNTGLDQEVQGESMCGTFTTLTECPVSDTSTIPESEQQFSSTSLDYDDPLVGILSSSTASEVELDVLKSTATSTPNQGVTYWGIAVPITITLAGDYRGLNTITAVVAEAPDWGAF